MLTEPALDRGRLAGVLTDRFGLVCDGLSFLPGGGRGWTYLASCREGRFLAKVRPAGGGPDTAGLGSGGSDPGGLEPGGPESAGLVAGGLGPWLVTAGVPVPRAVPTADGRWSADWEGLAVTVSAYVEAQLSDAEIFPPETADLLAATLARLHAIPTPRALGLPVEDFATYGTVLEPCLRALETRSGGRSERAAAVVLPHADRLRAGRDELALLAARVRSRRRGPVLTHGDPEPGNALLDAAGTLWLVDWDGAAVAPRERDLVPLTEPGLEPALDLYREQSRGYRPDPDLLGFFIRRRAFADVVHRLAPIARGGVEPEQEHADLNRIGWTLSRWDELDARVDRLMRSRRRGRGRRR